MMARTKTTRLEKAFREISRMDSEDSRHPMVMAMERIGTDDAQAMQRFLRTYLDSKRYIVPSVAVDMQHVRTDIARAAGKMPLANRAKAEQMWNEALDKVISQDGDLNGAAKDAARKTD